MQTLLDRLTIPHRVYIEREPIVLYSASEAPALIAQLRTAIFGEDGRNGGASESRSRLPLSAPALDLYQTVDDWISEQWARRFNRPPGIDQPETLLREWAQGREPDELTIFTDKFTITTSQRSHVASDLTATTTLEFLQMIETRIVALLERPTVQVPVKGPCPAIGCFATTITRTIDGEAITTPTLAFTRVQATGETTEVTCQSCGTSWEQNQFRDFAEALAATERGIKPHQLAQLRALS